MKTAEYNRIARILDGRKAAIEQQIQDYSQYGKLWAKEVEDWKRKLAAVEELIYFYSALEISENAT